MSERYRIQTAPGHSYQLRLRDGSWFITISGLESRVLAFFDADLFEDRMTRERFDEAVREEKIYVPKGLPEEDIPQMYGRRPLAGSISTLHAFRNGVRKDFLVHTRAITGVEHDTPTGEYAGAGR